ncbi:hypothetical protein [Thermosipho sp. (in: thermotogales)]|jgi:hypothetical protein|uniref:hypothetical protein n=1 Tax=Thermosipho sp. (in: thermotogales) TaxID=1968895 RepID=UPI002580D919|nr:hypothetical protein [Thermosipho sp. (in: thermotogales)]MBZ4649269.1 hypothetical protein [Thermosipho sp. (in: thermotogales)]
MDIEEEYFEKKLKEIPKNVLEKAVKFLKDNIPNDAKEYYIEMYNKNKHLIDWFLLEHFRSGMTIRNMLRKDANLSDYLLPDKNWDDYYIQVLEIALGIRKMEAC